MTGPAKVGHVGSQNLTTFQTFVTHNFLLQYGMVTQFSEIVHNLTGFLTHLIEPKCYISVLRFVSSNHMVYFSPHALFLQARLHIGKVTYTCFCSSRADHIFGLTIYSTNNVLKNDLVICSIISKYNTEKASWEK